jgi:hypothetical protein
MRVLCQDDMSRVDIDRWVQAASSFVRINLAIN